jgi:hypothetical protein
MLCIDFFKLKAIRKIKTILLKYGDMAGEIILCMYGYTEMEAFATYFDMDSSSLCSFSGRNL